MKFYKLILIAVFGALIGCTPPEIEPNPDCDSYNLHVIAGQSNAATIELLDYITAMEVHRPEACGVYVQHAITGSSMKRWYHGWGELVGEMTTQVEGSYFDELRNDLIPGAVIGRTIDTFTFVWVQGEADAKVYADFYGEALQGLFDAVESEWGSPVNFVLARLSDHGPRQANPVIVYGWSKIRQEQVLLADTSPRILWVDADDLNTYNTATDGLHYGPNYPIFAARLADSAALLIEADLAGVPLQNQDIPVDSDVDGILDSEDVTPYGIE